MNNKLFCTNLSTASVRVLDLLEKSALETAWSCNGCDLVDIFSMTDAVDYIDRNFEVFSHMEEKALAQELARYTMSQLPALVARVRGYPSLPEGCLSSALDELPQPSARSLF